jgi:hypothetical protein
MNTQKEHSMTKKRKRRDYYLLENWEALTDHNIAVLQNRKIPTGVCSEKVWIQIFGLQGVDCVNFIVQVFLFKCNPHLLTVQR